MSEFSGTKSDAPSSPPVKPLVVLRYVGQRLSVVEWLAMAAITMLVSTAMLFLQRPWNHLNSFAPAARSWWLEPIEWNSVKGLPEIKGNINGVAIQPGSRRVWIAGDVGLLAYSDDAGDHWTKLEYDPPTGIFSVAGSRGDTPAQSSMFGLAARVEAATLAPGDVKKPSTPPAAPKSAAPQPSNAPNADSKGQDVPNQQNPSPVQQSPIQQNPAPNAVSQTANQQQPNQIAVPPVIGMKRDVAEKELLGAGLRLGKVEIKEDPKQLGMVLGQVPSPGERVSPGTYVSIVVGGQKAASDQSQFKINGAAPGISDGSTRRIVRPVPSPPQPSATVNWPVPNLLAIKISNDVGTIHASDGRVFSSSNGGIYWTGTLLTAALYSPPPGGRNREHFYYKYISGANGGPAQVTRVGPVSMVSAPATIRSIWNLNPHASCDVEYDQSGGAVRCSQDGGLSEPRVQRTGKDHLEDVTFAQDGKVGWAVGANGVVLWTDDGGQHWRPKTQSAAVDMGISRSAGDWWRWLPPWFYAAWVFGLFCAAVAPLAIEEEAPVKFIQDYAASDRPLDRGDRDALDFTPLAKSLSAFVRNSATKPPLTISIDGPWGSGKSSLMNLMCADLREFGFRAIWFNAWHHQKEEHLLAALLQTVRLEAVPQLWDPSGIGFRIHLIFHRLKRYWFPMMLVTGLGVLLFFLDYSHSNRPGGHSLLVDLPRLLPAWLGGTGAEAGGLFARLNQWPSLGALLGLAALWPVLQKLLQAFGTNPAALLATVGKGNRIADLDAQTSFREKFAKEFRDVTQALGEDHQLVVFIDDLDRCRPENVRDVLEAVNFLVSSGECFVVMGLERKSVEAAVGLSLKDIAAEMADEKDIDKQEDKKNPSEVQNPVPANDGNPGVAARRKYSHDFLDKLINLEVPIPQLDTIKAQGLFYESAPNTDPAGADLAKRLRQRERSKRAERWVQYADGAVRFALGFAMSALLVWAGYNRGVKLEGYLRQMASTVKPAESRVLLAVQSSGVALQVVDTRSAPSNSATPSPAIGGSTEGGNPSAAGPSAPRATPAGPPPEIHPGSSPRPAPWNLSWPELGGIALLATFAYYALVEAGKGARHDSEKFVEALAIWYPLVIERQRTPRAVKRWMNRVRYLATRELPPSELRSPVERFADWYAARGEEKDSSSSEKAANETEQKPTQRIPEEIVVALAAIFELDPLLLTSEQKFLSLRTVDYTGEISSLGDGAYRASVNQLIREKRALHVEKMTLKSWDQIAECAPRFLARWPAIKIQ